MYEYSLTEWLLFFYIYCFLGWCFESSYVSLKSKKWTNRGFMHGPMLPIYGSGAVIVLIAALPFRQSPVEVYFMGMIAATILEYVVGASMEKMFRVRYWDYSYQKFNLNGHICLSSSIAWGFFSLGMVYRFHAPFESLVISLPQMVQESIAFLITLIAGADFMASLRTALDIRDVIIQAERMKQEVDRMKRRVEIIETFARADAVKLKENLEQELDKRIEPVVERAASEREKYAAAAELRKERLQERFTAVEDALNRIRQEILAGNRPEGLSDEHLKELIQIRENTARLKERIHDFYSKDKLRMLRANPTAIYRNLPGFLEELREEMWQALSEKDKD